MLFKSIYIFPQRKQKISRKFMIVKVEENSVLFCLVEEAAYSATKVFLCYLKHIKK